MLPGAVELTKNVICGTSAAEVFSAILGVMFAGQGAGQIGTWIENLGNGRSAIQAAIDVIDRPRTIDDGALERGSRKTLRASTKAKLTDLASENETSSEEDLNSAPPSSLPSPPPRIPKIEFRDVSFAYPSRPEDPILDRFSLTIEAGKSIALVGPSGCGKSTIIQLLNRFYDPVSGSILLDDVDITTIDVHTLRSMISMVSQEPVLFNLSVEENISYGANNNSCSHGEVVRAAKLAQADGFISGFPDGYGTACGEGGGSQMSGGQKQRICIARALVKKPKILICDEATSALDVQNELVVQQAIDSVLSTTASTSIIIAHRLSTLRNVDEIIVMNKGSVVERGKHAELLAIPSGLYEKLWSTQHTFAEGASGGSTPNMSRVPSAASLIGDAPTATKTSSSSTPHIEFRNVSFCYPARPEVTVLRSFNLTVERGQVVALVGKSGCGKR